MSLASAISTASISMDERICNTRELVIHAWSIPAAQMSAYTQVQSKLRANLLTIVAREQLGKIRPPTGNPVGAAIVLAIVLVLWLIIILIGASR